MILKIGGDIVGKWRRPPDATVHVFDGFGGSNSDDIRRFMHRIGGPRQHLRHHWRRHRKFGDKDWKGCDHHFNKVDKDSGRINDAVDGGKIFHKGGRHNKISDVGKVVLDKMLTGEDKKVEPMEQKPVVQEVTGVESLGLDFNKERERCLSEKVLFEDPEFPPESKSLYYKTPPRGPIKWLRPSDIVKEPCFLIDGESRFDVCQGELGDCWLLAAVANLTLRDELFFRVVPPDQSFTENYAGIFHFRFWRYGKWVDVVIDDRLPTINGQLIYMRSTTQNEFWSALIEKAYAKMFTCYECLDGGLPMDALEDFTGGLTEHFELAKTEKNTLFAMIVRGFQMGSFFCASIDADPDSFENQLSNGLIMGHAYSITAIQTLPSTQGDISLLRLRNPWGNNKEWTGAWSDKSSQWSTVDEVEKAKLQVAFNADGEFWMSIEDFIVNFEQLEICNLSADIEGEIEDMTGIKRDDGENTGSWQKPFVTVRGAQRTTQPVDASIISLSLTNAKNGVEGDGQCTVVVAVMQKYRRELRAQGKEDLPIGFIVYPAPADSGAKQNEQFFRTTKSLTKVPAFTNMREVTVRFRAPPGEYLIVPSTFEPYQEAEFLIRAYSNGDLKLTELH
ncbi:unnamed protein product, partial [Mesorhabditis spiculigera]